MIDLNELKKFLIKANLAGYASGNESSERKEADGSKTITFTDGDWKFHDNFFGGEPYGGREVIFHDNKPVFMMVYYGSVNQGENLKEVYPFLRKALSAFPEEYAYRGPKLLEEGDLRYTNEWRGEIDDFSGEEKIFKNGLEIYRAKYAGGLVDRQPD